MIIYTVAGGTKIVSITQRYQMIVILVGMAIAFAVAVYRLSPDLSFHSTLSVAGKMGKLEAVSFSVDPHKRYTFWSGVIGGFFLALSYFGADQSQVPTISCRWLAQRKPPGLALQRNGQSADAIFHSAAGRDCFHVLSIRKTTGLFQSTGLPTCGGKRLRAAASRATDTI